MPSGGDGRPNRVGGEGGRGAPGGADGKIRRGPDEAGHRGATGDGGLTPRARGDGGQPTPAGEDGGGTRAGGEVRPAGSNAADGGTPPLAGGASTTPVNGHARRDGKQRETAPARVLVAAGARAGGATTLVAGALPRSSLPEAPPPDEAPDPRDGYTAVAIDRDDDLAAVFGKIDAAGSPRVALVAARGNRELARQLGMRRLQRHLDLTGKDLILVTRSRLLRVRAREEGVPAVTSIRRVDFDHPDRRGLQLGWMTLRLPTLSALFAVAVFVASVAAGAAVLFWYVPTATVTVYLPAEALADTVDITVDSKAADVNVAKGVVPGHRREVMVQRSLVGPATGVAFSPLEHAAVGLIFVNRGGQAISVPKGTVVTSTSGMPFTVANDVNLAARAGATGEAIALAQRPGTVGNVAKGTVTRLDGPLAERVSVTNPAPGEKGTDQMHNVVGEGDVQLLKDVASKYMADAAAKELLQRYADSETVFADSARVEITAANPVPAINQSARYTELPTTAKVDMLTALDADLRQIWTDRFQQLIPPDKMLLDDQFKATVEKSGGLNETFDRLSVTMRVTAPAAQLVNRDELRRALAGKSRAGVERAVHDRLGVTTPPSVKLPGWAPVLPRKADRIAIVLKPAP